MNNFTNKIDFAVLVMVTDANPNGDPLNGNRPRETYDGYGEISDVCIKRKIRNRLQDMGENIFVQSNERVNDGYKSLSDRAKGNKIMQEALKNKDTDAYEKEACKTWIDVRAFGQVFAFKDNKGMSIGIRGPVSVQSAFSVEPIDIDSIQITKSVNSESGKTEKDSSTFGYKHRIEFGLYVFKGSINCQLAEKTGFSDEDAEKIKKALVTLFENDCSSARPEGSMQVCRVYWWKHDGKTPKVSSAKIHNAVQIKEKAELNGKEPNSVEDYDIVLNNPEGAVQPEIIDNI